MDGITGKVVLTLTERYVNSLADKVASGIKFERLTRMEDATNSKVEKAGLNIRIPFCALRCAYCALPGQTYDPRAATAFLNGLYVELGIYAESLGGVKIDRVYLSGGTPSLLHKEIPTILEIVEDRFSACKNVAIEASPTDLTPEILESLAASGVSQISIGVQTFDERMLRDVLNRNVRKEQMIKTLDQVMESGFDYVNMDLMFSLPGQSEKGLAKDLETAIELGVQGVSTYPLMLLPYTPMTKKLESQGVDVSTYQRASESQQYLTIVNRLREDGYKLRTLWSFSKNPEAYEGPYEHSNFLGIGPKAWGMLGDKMTLNVPNVFDYIRRLEEGFLPIFAYSPVKDYPVARLARHLYYGGVSSSELEKLAREDGQVAKYVLLMRAFRLAGRNSDGLYLRDKALAYGSSATKKIAMATLTKIDETMRSFSPSEPSIDTPPAIVPA
ncbi:MAG: radical SAM protein [Candidatus Saccharibacteria bacterium]